MLNLFDVVEIAPMRSLDEFILAKSRFEAPNFNNIDKWTNRINNNLLYYQTNYFFSMLVIFIIVTVLHPGEMMLGIIIMSSVFGLLYCGSSLQSQMKSIKKKHPSIVLISAFIFGYFIIYELNCVVTFIVGVVSPIIFIFVHASLRMRNMKNKALATKNAFWKRLSIDSQEVSSVAETFGVSKKTPMAIIFDEFGIEPEFKHSS